MGCSVEGAGAACVLWEPQPRLAKPPTLCLQLIMCTMLSVWVIQDISASNRLKIPTGMAQGPAGRRAPGQQVQVTRGKAGLGTMRSCKAGATAIGAEGEPQLSAQLPQLCCSPFPLV